MPGRDAFSNCHPVVNFLYFAAVLVFAAVLDHPACLAISLVCALAYSIRLNGRKAVRFQLVFMLPMCLFAALINPAFSHEGMTILTYLPGGNPLTAESIAFGAASAMRLAAVFAWFGCFSAVMTTDKFIYLFGRVIPALSLVLSMSLRFVPRFKAQLKTVADAQRCLGRDASSGGVIRRARAGITMLSIMATWALENAIETADSMKSRGYGLPGRTAFSIYRFDRRDRAALAAFAALCTGVAVCAATGRLYWRFYPTMRGVAPGVLPAAGAAAYLALCLMPAAIDHWEDRKWRALQSAA
jgi:energy-coupling factor transport system permease protein